MAQKFLQSIDLNGLELQNAVLQPLGTPPESPSVGRMYFHSTDGKPYWYDGSKFITFPLLSDVTTLQGYFTQGKANDSLKLGGVALDGLFTALSTSTTNAVSITVGGISKNITVADLKTSLGLKGLAYKDSLDVSDIPAIPWTKITANTRPTTLAGYGITDAYTKTDVNSELAKYLPLSGGKMDNGATIELSQYGTRILKIAGSSLLFDFSTDIGGSHAALIFKDKDEISNYLLHGHAQAGELEYIGFLSKYVNEKITPSVTISKGGQLAIGYGATIYEDDYLLRVNGSSYLKSIVIPTAGNIKIGEATLYYENGVLMVDKPFASTGAISTKGVGSSSGGGGSVDLTNIVSNILPASGSITGGVSSYNIGATDKRWGTVYANVGNFNNLSASEFSAQSINANTINVGGVSVATLTDINNAKAYAQQVANEAANSIYNTLLGGEVDESLDTIKEILDYVKDLNSENIVVKKTSTITGTGAKKSFDFQHNLNTKDVIVFVYEVSNPYQQVFVDVKMTSTSTITVEFAEAPANGTSYKVVVMA